MLSFNHEVFLEVARLLSFTRASQSLFISQPAISKHIQQLETQYKTSLFDRKGSSITLTESGKLLLDFLMKAKALEKQMDFEMNTHRDKLHVKGELKLGASTTIALYIIPSVLSGFHRKYPEVKMSLLNRNTEDILKALLNRDIDLGIVEGKGKLSMVHSQYFLTDEIVPVCSRHSSLSKKIKLSIADLKGIPIALRERGSGTLAVVKHALSSQGIKLSDLKISMRLGGTEALKNFVQADESLGFLSLRAVQKELSSGDLIRLYIEGLTIIRQFYFIQRHGENGGLNNSFISFAKSHYNIKL